MDSEDIKCVIRDNTTTPVDMKQIRTAIQQNAIIASLALILRIATSSYKHGVYQLLWRY
jgi:hypothetical protein